jgi:hypothetical protein
VRTCVFLCIFSRRHFVTFCSRVFTWGDPNEGKLGLLSAVTAKRPACVAAAPSQYSPLDLQAASAFAECNPAGAQQPSPETISKGSFSLPHEVESVCRITSIPHNSRDMFQLHEFGPYFHQMFAVEVACGCRHVESQPCLRVHFHLALFTIPPHPQPHPCSHSLQQRLLLGNRRRRCRSPRCHTVCVALTVCTGQLGLGRLHNFRCICLHSLPQELMTKQLYPCNHQATVRVGCDTG